MKLKKYDSKLYCNSCKSFGENGFEIDFDKRFYNNIKICKKCAELFYKSLGEHLIPKGIKNINSNQKLVEKDFSNLI